jgi:hypothetical protein
VYEDSVNIDDIMALLTSAIDSIKPGAGGTLAPSTAPAHQTQTHQ